jgi:acyl-coenzyme A thioesterase PaaI-like protein
MSESNDLMERMRIYQGGAGKPSEESVARREVADELRALGHAIGGSNASPRQMREVAAQLRLQGEVLADAGEVPARSPTTEPVTVPGMEDFHDRSPIAGRANPIAPPAILGVDPDAAIVVGEVTFGAAFEGAPGCVHGGFVAAVLDEALGMASALSGTACMTAELTTRYRRHTPVSTALRIEARLVSVEGRKVRTSGEVYHGDAVLAEGSGLFIAVDAAKFQQLVVARSEDATD